MKNMRESLLAVGVATAILGQAAQAETDAERIERLEALVEQQQKMLEALTDEVREGGGVEPGTPAGHRYGR
jgi:cob(I)alamin adenosyltransferase